MGLDLEHGGICIGIDNISLAYRRPVRDVPVWNGAVVPVTRVFPIRKIICRFQTRQESIRFTPSITPIPARRVTRAKRNSPLVQ